MKRFHSATLTIIASLCLAFRVAAASTEADLIQVLQSNEPSAKKNAACARLNQIGTARSVPALATLLTDEQLSHPARQALESMSAPEASKALREALKKTTGFARVGVIDSLGMRRDEAAVGALAGLLHDKDPDVARGAACALGRIGNSKCIAPLRKAFARATPNVRPAVVDGLLRCATALRADGQTQKAEKVYRTLFAAGESPAVRQAAYCGVLRCSGAETPAALSAALQGSDRAAQLAALQVAAELPGETITRTLTSVLPKTAPSVEVALLKALASRDDVTAVSAVIAVAESSDPAVRLAAVDALSEIGDSTSVPLLVARASKRGPEQEAARQALARLHHGEVRQTLFALADKGDVTARMEVIRAIAARRDPQAIPVLTKQAQAQDERIQRTAVQALSAVADAATVGSLVRLLATSESEAVRSALEDSFALIAERLQQTNDISSALLAALPGASAPGRASLLRAAGSLGGPKVLTALRTAAKEADPMIRDAAIRTMAEFPSAETAPDLLTITTQAPSETIRILALRGFWRAVGLNIHQPIETRLQLCRDGLAAARNPDEKRMGLTELGRIPTLAALELVNSSRGAGLKSEADLAAYQVASRLVGSHRTQAKAALLQISSEAEDNHLRSNAAALLKAIDEHSDYLAAWLISGPYRQDGKDGSALFDVTFPPEQPGASAAIWQPAPPCSNPTLFWQTDLGSVVGGNHCVVYLKTRLFSPEQRPVSLAIGVDDGIKLWVNGKNVHANNVARPLVPDQDKARATLDEGWNDVLAKVTQHTAGCGLCIRVRAEDGSPLQDLRCDPEGR